MATLNLLDVQVNEEGWGCDHHRSDADLTNHRTEEAEAWPRMFGVAHLQSCCLVQAAWRASGPGERALRTVFQK